MGVLEKRAQFIADLPFGQAVFIVGPPGIGKTALAYLVSQHTPRNPDSPDDPVVSVVMEASAMNPEDIMGLPFRDEDATFFAPPYELATLSRRDCRAILVLDDFAAADGSTLKAFFRLVCERKIGSLELSRNVRIIATGNRREDKSGAVTLPAALRNRFMILEFQPDMDSWAEWYTKQELPHEVLGYLKWQPDKLSMLPGTADEKGAFATPRQWEAVGRCLRTAQKHGMVHEAVSGLVGNVGNEFVTFLNVFDKIPPPEKILEDPEGAVPKIPRSDQIDVMIAMMGSIANYAARKRGKKAEEMAAKFLKAVAYVSQHGREYAGVAIDSYSCNGGKVDNISACIRDGDLMKDKLVVDLMKHVYAAIGG